MGFHARLRELGYELPGVAKPLASYVPAVRVGDQVWTSGQLPLVEGALPLTGKVGAEVTTEQAQEQARIAALNARAGHDDLAGPGHVVTVDVRPRGVGGAGAAQTSRWPPRCT